MADRAVVIGITGPTGAGKSTVDAALEKLGCHIIDCDTLARDAVEQIDCKDALLKAFGSDIMVEGVLNRRLLAERAFRDSNSAQTLNKITHPVILRMLREKIDEARREGAPAIVADAALLFESGADALCDVTVAVTADLETRAARIMQRDGISRELALARIAAQQNGEYYTSRATYAIDGGVALNQVPSEAKRVFDAITQVWREA